MNEKRIIPLNILYNYPVYWNDYQILRDFVQNFYDAKPAGEWWQNFHYRYDVENQMLEIVMDNSSFSYEWLLHIGASSKTGGDAAGYFGEGFKIAALCAIRDKHWDVVMSSGDWRIHVVGKEILLDGTHQKELAYELEKTDMCKTSRLVIGRISNEGYRVFQDALMAFFFPENPLLGEKIFENDVVAVYTRSDIPVPSSLPCTSLFGRSGAVFARKQMLGTLPFPCVVALHPYEQLDRERKKLYEHDILKILYIAADEMSPEAAKYILEQIPDKWNALPKKLVDLESWYYVVCQLIRTICRSTEVKYRFIEEHPELLYTRRFLDNDIPAQNRRRIAKAWLLNQPYRYRLVMEQFKLLGYSELEEVCEAAGGFADCSMPTETESKYIRILNNIRKKLFPSFFPIKEDIPAKVIRAENAGVAGLAEIKKVRNGAVNSHGIKVRNELITLAIQEDCLRPDMFDHALSVYLHEISHMFGGDNTQNFSLALTELIAMVSAKHKELEGYRKEWEKICEEESQF